MSLPWYSRDAALTISANAPTSVTRRSCLTEIEEDMLKVAGLGLIKRVIKRRSIHEHVARHKEKLGNVIQNFTVRFPLQLLLTLLIYLRCIGSFLRPDRCETQPDARNRVRIEYCIVCKQQSDGSAAEADISRSDGAHSSIR